MREYVRSDHPPTRVLSSSLDEFYRVHPEIAPQQVPPFGNDEHYAERLFLEKVVFPTLGPLGLLRLTPQKTFLDERRVERRIDFALEGEQSYAIEVEGETWHGADALRGDRFTDEKQRQRSLSAAGYIYKPFSFAEIRDGHAKSAFEGLCADDRILRAIMEENRLAPPSQDRSRPSPELERADLFWRLIRWLPSVFQETQLGLVGLVQKWVEAETAEVSVVNVKPEIGLLNLALADLLCLVERTAKLHGLDVKLPRVTIHNVGAHTQLLDTILRNYYRWRREPEQSDDDRRVDPTLSHSVVNTSSGTPKDQRPDCFYLEKDTTRLGVVNLERLRAQRADPLCCAEPPLWPTDAQRQKPTLDYFARRWFPPVLRLRDEQHQAITRTLERRSLLVLLPTGYGKSLCFQLPAMLVPAVVLVVSPLRALIRDQVWGLHQLGLQGIASITSFDSSAKKDEKLARLERGEVRLLYVSPERLQIRAFCQSLSRILQRIRVWALVVDEAHCVSEWGHDFRPAYLQIRHFRTDLEATIGQRVPILALTATASQLVRTDICNVLDIDDPPLATPSSNRREISISVHAASRPGDEDGKERTTRQGWLVDLFSERIPRALGRDALVLSGEPPFSDAAVVFSIYADPHGKHTIPLGLADIRETIISNQLTGEDLCRVHCTKPVQVCPECASHRIQRVRNGRANRDWECPDCGTRFPVPGRLEPDWEVYLKATQDAFKQDQFPLLVSTKGYGMGIDKRNIRAIVHFTFSSRLEGYYQEVDDCSIGEGGTLHWQGPGHIAARGVVRNRG